MADKAVLETELRSENDNEENETAPENHECPTDAARLSGSEYFHPKNLYESRINLQDPRDIVVAVDKTAKKQMYCVSKEWIDFEKGFLLLPKLRGANWHITDEEYCKIMKKLIIEATPIHTKSMQFCHPTSPKSAFQNVRIRGGARGGGKKSTLNRIITKTREVFITWKEYKIKVLLKDFCEYNMRR
jgi:hypothetical protein